MNKKLKLYFLWFAIPTMVSAIFYFVGVFINWQWWPNDQGPQDLAASFLRFVWVITFVVSILCIEEKDIK